MEPSTKKAVLLVVLVVLATVLATVFALPILLPQFASVSSLVKKLDSEDRDTVLEGYYFLTRKKDPTAVDQAVIHLGSDDEYVWLNAALYLGACEKETAVPYLIKALRHTAWRADDETVKYLRELTGQNFGADFSAWKSWWDGSGREVEIDWTSKLGHDPRTTRAEQAETDVPRSIERHRK